MSAEDPAQPLLAGTKAERSVRFKSGEKPNTAVHIAAAGATSPALSGEIRVYASRWGMLALFCLSTMTNAIIWISFAPISSESQVFYGVGTLAVNSLSMSFMLLYLPGSMLASYVLDRWGLRGGMVTAGAMGAVSCWIRYVSVFPSAGGYSRFALVLFGQCIAALAQPFYTNAPAKLAGSWFPPKQREIATTIAAILNPVGNAIGSVMPGLVVTQPNDMGFMLIIEAIFATLTFLPVLLFFKSKPPFPPSASASSRDMLRSASLKRHAAVDSADLTSSQRIRHEILILLRNPNYVYLLCGFGLGLGLFNALITIMAQLVAPCGYGSSDAGILSGILIGAGLFGAAVAGPAMEMTKAYRPILKCGVVAAVAGTTTFLLALKPDNFTVLAALAGVMGFCMIPLLPVVLENNAELTYPIPEETGSGLLLLNGQLFGIIFIIVFDYLIPLRATYVNVFTPAAILIWTAFGVALVTLFVYNGKYHRLEHERTVAKQLKSPVGLYSEGEESTHDFRASDVPPSPGPAS